MEATVKIAWDPQPLPPRFFSALTLGGLLGGVLTPVWLAVVDTDILTLALFPIIAPFAAVFWLIGLLVVGAPGWSVLHHLGLRSAWAAVGFGLAALSPALFVGGLQPSTLFPAVTFILMGGIVGLAIWRMAYKKAAS